jgi:hypothetical protein
MIARLFSIVILALTYTYVCYAEDAPVSPSSPLSESNPPSASPPSNLNRFHLESPTIFDKPDLFTVNNDKASLDASVSTRTSFFAPALHLPVIFSLPGSDAPVSLWDAATQIYSADIDDTAGTTVTADETATSGLCGQLQSAMSQLFDRLLSPSDVPDDADQPAPEQTLLSLLHPYARLSYAPRELPFAGQFLTVRGLRLWALLLQRHLAVRHAQVQVHASDPDTGLCVLQTEISGKFKNSGNAFSRVEHFWDVQSLDGRVTAATLYHGRGGHAFLAAHRGRAEALAQGLARRILRHGVAGARVRAAVAPDAEVALLPAAAGAAGVVVSGSDALELAADEATAQAQAENRDHKYGSGQICTNMSRMSSFSPLPPPPARTPAGPSRTCPSSRSRCRTRGTTAPCSQQTTRHAGPRSRGCARACPPRTGCTGTATTTRATPQRRSAPTATAVSRSTGTRISHTCAHGESHAEFFLPCDVKLFFVF